MRYSRGLGGGAGWTRVQLPDRRNVTIKGDRATRNNNPGNVEYGKFARRHGAIGTDGRFAVFGSRQAGIRAQSALLFGSKDYRNLTLGEAIASYAPDFENNTAAYAAAVSAATGIPLDTKMSDIPENMRESVVTAMHAVESGNAPTARVYDEDGTHIGTIDPRFANTPEFGAPTPYGPNDVLANAPLMRPDNAAYTGPSGRFTVDRAPSIASFGGIPTPGLSSGFLNNGLPSMQVATSRVPGRQFDSMPAASSNFGINHGAAGAVAGLPAHAVRSVSYGPDGNPRRSMSAFEALGFTSPAYAGDRLASAPRLGGGLMDPIGSLGPGVSPSYQPSRTLSGVSDVRPMPSGPVAPSMPSTVASTTSSISPSTLADAYSQYGATLDEVGVRLDGTPTRYTDPTVSVVNPNRVSTMPPQSVPTISPVPPTTAVAPVYSPPRTVAPMQESGFPAAPPAPSRPSIADVYAGAPGTAISNSGIEVSRAPGGFIDRYNPDFDVTTVETPQGYQASTFGRGRLNRTDQARSLLGAKSLSSRAMKNIGGTLLGGILGGAVAGPAGGVLGGFLGNQLARGNTFRGILGGILGDGFLGGDYPARPGGGVISNGPGLSMSEMRDISPGAARAVSKGKAGLY